MDEINFRSLEPLGGFPEMEKQVSEKSGKGFGKFLEDAFLETNRLQNEKEEIVQNFASGRETDIHKTMIAVQKAEVSFKLMMAVTNNIRKAYEDIKNMQI